MLSPNHIDAVIETILIDSDLPDLLLARDRVGTTYLCSLAEVGPDAFTFLAVQISSDRLGALRSGKLDLRTVLSEPEMSLHFTGRMGATDPPASSLTLAALTDDVPERWLPEPGFLLSALEDRVSDDVVVKDALAKNAPVIVCTLTPQESMGTESKMDAANLAKYIQRFQTLVKYATSDVLKRVRNRQRKAQYKDDAACLNVFAFSAGSFNIHFEARDRPDLFGHSMVGLAMREVDELMELATKPAEEARLGLRQRRGHVLTAYQSLMEFASTRAPFAYRWSDPGMSVPSGGSVTSIQAASMVAVLSHEKELKAEPFVFRGHFTSVNTDKKPWSWTARDADEKIRRGYVHESNPAVLDGVTIKTKDYLLSGDERLVEIRGETSLRLFLKSAPEFKG